MDLDSELELIVEWELIHEHCLNCFNMNCSAKGACEMAQCQKCGAKLHICKMDDHLEGICPKTAIKCPNWKYGCQIEIMRDHLAIHLKRCNAYIIHCSFCWSRSFVSIMAKRFFKRVAKELEGSQKFESNVENADIEILRALQDQDQIFDSMKCSRLCRVKQRDYVNRSHPLLPLRYKQHPAFYSAMDSSDEEENDEQIIMRSTPQAFAGCPICRTDPGEQHLHILGNINAKDPKDPYDPDIKLQESNSTLPLDVLLPSANLKYNLFLNLEQGKASARSMTNPKLIHMFCCDQIVRRDEYWDHMQYHKDISHFDGDRFVRCQYSCGFGVEKYISKNGQFLYDKFFGTILHKNIQTSIHEPSGGLDIKLTKLMAVLKMASYYLDSATLNSLSATCSWIRSNIYSYFPNRYIIYKGWQKKRHADGRIEWIMGEEKWKFTKVQCPTWTIIQNPQFAGILEKHKQECPTMEINYNALPLLQTAYLMELTRMM